jgi:hypothetical protein
MTGRLIRNAEVIGVNDDVYRHKDPVTSSVSRSPRRPASSG